MSDRSLFRLRFPPSAALTLSTDIGDFVVCELSEGGMRIAGNHGSRIRIGQLIVGTLIFHDGSRAAVQGIAQRQDHSELVITQLVGIAFDVMMREQQYVVANFPTSSLSTTTLNLPTPGNVAT